MTTLELLDQGLVREKGKKDLLCHDKMSLMLKSSTKKKVFCLTLLKARFEFYSKANTEHGTKFVGQMQASFWGGKKKKPRLCEGISL